MTRKDYQLIARAIHKAYKDSDGGKNLIPETHAAHAGIGRVQMLLTMALAEDNPRFDSARFAEACETGKGVK